MRLPPGEPAFGPWTVRPAAAVAAELTGARPAVVAVDGRSGSGKTTAADALAAAVPGAAVVRTDDLAWHESFFGWAHLLDAVLRAVRAGDEVAFRPPAWDARGRPGAVRVPAGAPLVLVEGVGAARTETFAWFDAAVWVQADHDVAERRGIARDGGDAAAGAFWHEWAAEELPFLAAQRPWERADLVVCGTPAIHLPSGCLAVAGRQLPG